MKKQETSLAGKERELREQMRRERDKEIEKIIAQFESDTTMTKEEAERTAENRVKSVTSFFSLRLTLFPRLDESETSTKPNFASWNIRKNKRKNGSIR